MPSSKDQKNLIRVRMAKTGETYSTARRHVLSIGEAPSQAEDASPPPTVVRPHAVLDTNVILALYSWHDLLAAAEPVIDSDPTADLTHSKIQFRSQRARSALLLALFLNENGWTTVGPLHELLRKLKEVAPPEGEVHGVRSNYVRFFVYFVKDKLLPKWVMASDENADIHISGTDVDRLCLDWADEQKVPLVSWEGHGPNGFDKTRFMPKEALARGIDLVSPDELLLRMKFDPTDALRRFATGWRSDGAAYLNENPSARETMKVLGPYFRRLVSNDWTR